MKNPIQINLRKDQLEQNRFYQNLAIQNFPFGKQGIKISEYVSNQLNNKQQQQNARILQQFRRKAIEDKFHCKYGHLKNSRLIQRYITQSMLPGITVNPSMVIDLGAQLKKYSLAQQQQKHFTRYVQPSYMSTLDNNSHLYNATYKSQLKAEHPSNFIASNLNSLKQTIDSHCQTESIESSPEIQKLKSINLKQKNSKGKFNKFKKQIKQFLKIENMIRSLNQQIQENSNFLQYALSDESNQQKKPKQAYNINSNSAYHKIIDHKHKSTIAKHSRSRINTEPKAKNKFSQNWKINNSIFYNSAQSSFFKETGVVVKPKPLIQFTSKPQKNLGRIENFTPLIKRKSRRINQDSALNQTLINDENQMGIQKIRQHLKLLKKHTNRIETINLVQ